MPLTREKKINYFVHMTKLLEHYNRMFLVQLDNVGSLQLQRIRSALRNKAVLLMGKNTMMRKCIRVFLEKNPGHQWAAILPIIRGNVGFCYIEKGVDLAEVRKVIDANSVPAPARVGLVSPCDVFVEPGATGCDPGQTSWFQALNIPTKIVKGQIEMVNRTHLIKQGDKVSESAAALLQKLNILPFKFQVVISGVYDNGSFYGPKVLDMTSDEVAKRFMAGLTRLTAVSLGAGYPTLASLPHTLSGALKKLVAVGIASDYIFPKAAAFLNAAASAPAAAAPAAAPAAGKKEEKKEEKPKEEEKSEEEGGGMGGLFGGDDDF